MLAVELVEDKGQRLFFDPAQGVGAKVAAALLKHGVIARAMPEGDIIGLAPPFCLTQNEADEIIAKLTRAIIEVLGE